MIKKEQNLSLTGQINGIISKWLLTNEVGIYRIFKNMKSK